MTEQGVAVKPLAERLAELEAEMDDAQRANDPTAWLRAWHEADDLKVAQFLAEYPQYAADPDEPVEDWGPAELLARGRVGRRPV